MPNEEETFIDSAPVRVGSRVVEKVLLYVRIRDECLLCVQLCPTVQLCKGMRFG